MGLIQVDNDGRWPGRGEILRHVHEVARRRDRTESYREQVSELLLLATEREAVVAQAYMGSALEERIAALHRAHPTKHAIVDLINEVIQYIWSQEQGHTAELGSLAVIGGSGFATWRTQVFGRFQGWLTQAAAGTQPLRHAIAQSIISIGVKMALAPSFAAAVTELTHREFFDLKVELEEAAVLGYEQLGDVLHESLRKNGKLPINIGLQSTIGRIYMDEVRHRELFRSIWSWLTPRNRLNAGLTYERCARAVRNIFEDFPMLPVALEGRYAASEDRLLIDTATAALLTRIGVSASPASRTDLDAAGRALLLREG